MHDERDLELPDVAALNDPALAAQVRHAIDHKTKPLGALGQLEALALQLALIQGRDLPQLDQPQMLVFAADHGLAARGVSAYPADVTAQMVLNFLHGGAAVSVLARQHGLALTVVDVGVRQAFEPHPRLRRHKVAPGTADASQAQAMSLSQCAQAIAVGREVVASLPGNAVLLGEMGIGNSSAAAMLVARLTDHPIAACTGRGTGLDEAALSRKIAVLAEVLVHHADAVEPLDALAAFGGLEIAALVGAVLQAAEDGRVIVVDGYIVGAAVLVAMRLRPAVLQRCVFAHRSQEPGHRLLLDHFGVRPLLDLDLRLGEGSGAALAWPLLVSACAFLAEMASFESAGVSGPAA